MSRLAGGAVRVGELESALVLGAWREIQDRAGEAIGHGVVEIFAAAEDVLAADAHQRQRVAPCRLADGAELNRDARVAVGVSSDRPLEARVKERGMLDMETAGGSRVLHLLGP